MSVHSATRSSATFAAEDRSPSTRITYAAAIDLLAAFVAEAGMPELTELRREHIEAFLVDLGRRGQRPATLANRYRSLQQFYKWLLEEGEVKVNPMANMRPPHVPEEPPEVLRPDKLRARLATCDGTDFEDRRDIAVLRLRQAWDEHSRAENAAAYADYAKAKKHKADAGVRERMAIDARIDAERKGAA